MSAGDSDRIIHCNRNKRRTLSRSRNRRGKEKEKRSEENNARNGPRVSHGGSTLPGPAVRRWQGDGRVSESGWGGGQGQQGDAVTDTRTFAPSPLPLALSPPGYVDTLLVISRCKLGTA